MNLNFVVCQLFLFTLYDDVDCGNICSKTCLVIIPFCLPLSKHQNDFHGQSLSEAMLCSVFWPNSFSSLISLSQLKWLSFLSSELWKSVTINHKYVLLVIRCWHLYPLSSFYLILSLFDLFQSPTVELNPKYVGFVVLLHQKPLDGLLGRPDLFAVHIYSRLDILNLTCCHILKQLLHTIFTVDKIIQIHLHFIAYLIYCTMDYYWYNYIL